MELEVAKDLRVGIKTVTKIRKEFFADDNLYNYDDDDDEENQNENNDINNQTDCDSKRRLQTQQRANT